MRWHRSDFSLDLDTELLRREGGVSVVAMRNGLRWTRCVCLGRIGSGILVACLYRGTDFQGSTG